MSILLPLNTNISLPLSEFYKQSLSILVYVIKKLSAQIRINPGIGVTSHP